MGIDKPYTIINYYTFMLAAKNTEIKQDKKGAYPKQSEQKDARKLIFEKI
jgi:hypothetical protein